MHDKKRAIIELNLGIIAMSASATFGKVIQWHPTVIIFWRMLIAGIALFLWLKLRKKRMALDTKKDLIIMITLGFLLAIHWSLFFAAAQMATVAVALVSVNTHPLWATLIEPVVSDERYDATNVLSALIALVGLALMIEQWSFGAASMQGASIGLLSGLCMALRNIYSKTHVQKYSGTTVMLYQLLAGAALLIPFAWLFPPSARASDIVNLLVLATVATSLAHTLTLASLKHLSASASTITYLMINVYGTLIAAFAIGEVPSPRVILGGAIVTSAVVLQTCRQSKVR